MHLKKEVNKNLLHQGGGKIFPVRSSQLLILLIPFFVCGLWQQRNLLNFVSQNFLSGISSFQLNNDILSLSLKMFFILIPFLVVIAFELIFLYKESDFNISGTTLGKLRSTNYHDVWYTFLRLFFNKITLFLPFLTLGFTSINNKLGTLLESFYTSFIPPEYSLFNSSLLVISVLVLRDYTLYWSHRIYHQNSILWDIHEFHHSATEMTVFNRNRLSLLEDIIIMPFFAPITVITSLIVSAYFSQGHILPLIIYMAYVGYLQFADTIAHSGIRIIYPKPISYILMSPSLHWLHHSKNPNHYDCNFSVAFSFWDRIHGTYLSEEYLKDIDQYGVIGTTYNNYHPVYSFTILPILKTTRNLTKLLSSSS